MKYVLRRAFGALVTLFLLATLTFGLVHAVPGDPLATNKVSHPDARRNLEIHYGLDQPLSKQYVRFLSQTLQGDFGMSFSEPNRSVNDIIRTHFPVSAVVGLLALLISVGGAFILGAWSAVKPGHKGDTLVLVLSVLMVSVPSFVLAAILQWGLSGLNQMVGRELIPIGGWGELKHCFLPALVLSLSTLAFLTRLFRTTLLEVRGEDYVRVMRAHGLSKRQLFFRHEFRNAALPLLAYLGPAAATLATGGFVVETVFAVPGLGKYFIQAVVALDYTVILGLTVFYGAFLIFMVFLMDVLYRVLDPRVRA